MWGFGMYKGASLAKNSLSIPATIALLFVFEAANRSASGREKNEVRFEGELFVEFESDHTFRSDDPNMEITDSYPTLGLAASWIFNPNFSINGSFTAEPVLDPAPGADRKFGEYVGLFAEEIHARFQFGDMWLLAGKFNPGFGQAWNLTPGVFGTSFAEDYQLTERVGFGLVYARRGSVWGDLDFSANLFTMDNSELGNSIFNQRGRTRLANGGAGNTGELDNFSLTLDGHNMAMLPGLAWHLGYAFQSRGKTASYLFDEKRLVAGVHGSHSPAAGLSVEWVGEVASIENVGGSQDHAIYYTLGGGITFAEKYNLAIAHTRRAFDISAGRGFDDTITQISFGLELYRGWTIDVGYALAQVEHIESETFGLLLGKTFSLTPIMDKEKIYY